jgi:peroxiredoxin
LIIGRKRERPVPETRLLALNARVGEPGEFRLLKSEVTIGSGEDNQFVIRRPSVSRRHASLVFRKDRYEISDPSSTNGTFVSGRRVSSPTIVEIGDEIRFGDAVFVIAKPADSGVPTSARKSAPPKRVFTLRGAFELGLVAFAVGFGASNYLAYLVYHEQNRLILAKAEPLLNSQPPHVTNPIPKAAPSKSAATAKPRAAGAAKSGPSGPARTAAPPAGGGNTSPPDELVGALALTRLFPGSGSQAGELAQDFRLQNLAGQWVSLASFRGKIVLLNFWATWCGACRGEMPSLEKLYKDLGRYDDFVILAVSLDQQGRDTVVPFMQKNGYEFTVLLDPETRVGGLYGVSGLPTTFIIGRTGHILWSCVGGFDWSNPDVRQALAKLVGPTMATARVE